jgi:hypothetical protein
MTLSDGIQDLLQKVGQAITSPLPAGPDDKASKKLHDEYKARIEQERNIYKSTLDELKERQETEHKADTDGLAEIEKKLGELESLDSKRLKEREQARAHAHAHPHEHPQTEAHAASHASKK